MLSPTRAVEGHRLRPHLSHRPSWAFCTAVMPSALGSPARRGACWAAVKPSTLGSPARREPSRGHSLLDHLGGETRSRPGGMLRPVWGRGPVVWGVPILDKGRK